MILVDQAGVPADLDAMRALCEPRGITVVEDAACAVGSVYRGRPVGAGADLAAFSFHPRKLLTTGEGGMLVTPDAEVAARLRRLREHGMDVSAAQRHASRQPVIEHYLEMGFNYRMTDVQAAIGLVQLGQARPDGRAAPTAGAALPASAARVYLACGPSRTPTTAPRITSRSGYCSQTTSPSPATRLSPCWPQAGVSARRGIMAAHLEPAYAGHPGPALPVTELLTSRSLILPLFHDLSESEQDLVVSAVRASQDQSRAASQAPVKVP